jgi:hypothetical protein
MARARSRVDRTESGDVFVRSAVPSALWRVVEKFSERMQISPTQAYWMLLVRLTSLIETGDYEFLGPEFTTCVGELVVRDQIGSNGLPPVAEYATKLHRTERTRSGFVGVYVNGKGFRAVGRAVGSRSASSHVVGTYPTAEQAALARYLYYKKNRLPYGELEDAIEWAREQLGPDATDEDCLEHFNITRTVAGKEPFTLDDTLEDINKKASDKRPPKVFGFDVPPEEFG